MSHFAIDRTVTRALLSGFEHHTNDVLPSATAQRKRFADLYKAVSLESLFQQQVLFWIEGDDCCYPIVSRITALGDRTVFLERNLRVPISSICHIDFDRFNRQRFS